MTKWQTFQQWARRYNAVALRAMHEAAKYPNNRVAFESRNFGFILSERDHMVKVESF